MRSGAEVMDDMMAASYTPESIQQHNLSTNQNHKEDVVEATAEKTQKSAEEQKAHAEKAKKLQEAVDAKRAKLEEEDQVKSIYELEKISNLKTQAERAARTKVFDRIVDGEQIPVSRIEREYEDALSAEETSSF